MASAEEIQARVTGPGGPFEFVVDDVLGERMQVVSGRARSLRELLERSALHDDKEYIVHGERRIAYAEHLRLVASVARGLSQRYGVGKGDRVAILAENRPEWLLTFWATVSLGGIVAALALSAPTALRVSVPMGVLVGVLLGLITPIGDVGIFHPAREAHQDFHRKNPLRYKAYKYACGRAARLEALWGKR